MDSNKDPQGQGGYGAAGQWNDLHHIASGSSSNVPIDMLNFQQQQKQMIPPRHHPIHQATMRMIQQQQQPEALLLPHMYNQDYGLQALPDFTSRMHTSGQQNFDYLQNSASRAVYQAFNTAGECSTTQQFQVESDAALHGLPKENSEAANFPRMFLSKLETNTTSPAVEGIKSKPRPTRSFTKVLKLGSIGRSMDVTRFSNYADLRAELARMFGLEGQLDQNSGWQLVFMDNEGDILLVGDDPWEVFVNSVRGIRILSPAEVAVYTSSEDFAGTRLSTCLSGRR